MALAPIYDVLHGNLPAAEAAPAGALRAASPAETVAALREPASMPRSRAAAAVVALAVAGLGAADAAARVTGPPGVRVTTVARGVGQPSNIAFDSRGGIWTTSAHYVARRTDGVWHTPRAGARPRHVLRLRAALGLAWHRGTLYVSHQTRRRDGAVTAFSGFDGRRFRRRRAVLRDVPVGRHSVDSVVAGADGRLYLGVGSQGDATPPRHRLSAAVISFPPSGRGVRVEARGLRNPFGLAFVPGTRDLLVSDNGRDDLGPSRPPDELNLLRLSPRPRRPPWFGFPGCHHQGGPACRAARAPLARLPPHSAAAGVAVARRFGRYGLSAFVAQNGATQAGVRTGNDVLRVSLRPRSGGYSARVHRFARGFARHDPVGLAIGPDGALYATLVNSGRVLRFVAR